MLIATYYVIFGNGDTTVYAKGYTEARFESIKEGMTDKQVRGILGAPLSISQDVVFTKRLSENSNETDYCSFVNGRRISGSVLLDSRSRGKNVTSIEEAMSLLTPEERKLARIQYVWEYAEPEAVLSQHHQFRNITFDNHGIVIDKFSWEWVD